MSLSGTQYVGAQSLAEALDSVAARLPHAHMRPHFRPKQGRASVCSAVSPSLGLVQERWASLSAHTPR